MCVLLAHDHMAIGICDILGYPLNLTVCNPVPGLPAEVDLQGRNYIGCPLAHASGVNLLFMTTRQQVEPIICVASWPQQLTALCFGLLIQLFGHAGLAAEAALAHFGSCYKLLMSTGEPVKASGSILACTQQLTPSRLRFLYVLSSCRAIPVHAARLPDR